MSDISQGDTGSTRTGEAISPDSLKIAYKVRANTSSSNVYNIRVVVVQYLPLADTLSEAAIQTNIWADFDSSVASDFMYGDFQWNFRET
jgi:hypothetical protein